MSAHEDYEAVVQSWDAKVDAHPCRETYTDRWQARIRHPSWEEKRQAFLWYTNGSCERCGIRTRPADLQLHHLHYDSLWYENNGDLELLCLPCHRIADEERAEAEMLRKRPLTLEERAIAYMETANRFSEQPDWPVTYKMAIDKVLNWEEGL